MASNIPRLPPTTSVTVSNFGTVPIDSPEYVAYLFDISSKGRYAPLDPDLQKLALSLQNTDFSSQAQLLMIDLIRILAQIRRQTHELSHSQSALAFTSALSTAEHQKRQAQHQAMAERINAGVMIFQGLSEMGSGAAQMAATAKAYHSTKAEAQSLFKNDANNRARTNTNSSTNDTEGPAEFTRPAGAPPPYSAKPETYVVSEKKGSTSSSSKANESKSSSSKGSEVLPGDDEGSAERGTGSDTVNQIDKKGMDQYVTDKMRNFHMEMDNKFRVVNGLVQVFAGIIKQFSAQETLRAGQEQAMATIEQAFMQYVNNQSQVNADYASEMREWVRGILDLLRSTEQARHQAAQAIIQIA